MRRNSFTLVRWHRLRARNEFRRLKRARKRAPDPEAARAIDSAARVPEPSTTSHAPTITIGRGPRRRRTAFIELPADFSLKSNYDEVAGFFTRFRSLAYNRNAFTGPWGVEFSTMKNVAPGAALMLAAELYRLQRHIGRRLRAVHQDDWDPTVRKTLHELGLFKLLSTPNMKDDSDSNPLMQILEYSVDTSVDGNKCGTLLDCLGDIAGEIPAQNFIYDGLVEALKNCKHHAYPDDGTWHGVEPGTWFMTGSYNRSKMELTAAVFDLGIGIPASLPRSGVWEHVRPFLRFGSDDAQMISAAMQYGRTRTTLQGRGKGIPIMMRLLDHHHGYLRIVSGKGEAMYDSLTKSIRETSHAESIGGTLIEWSISRDRRN